MKNGNTVIFIFLMFLISSFVFAETTKESGNNRSAEDWLKEEIREVQSMSSKLTEAGLKETGFSYMQGQLWNEYWGPEGDCFSIGVLIGQYDSVKHLRIPRSLKPTEKDIYLAGDYGWALLLMARAADNFVTSAKNAISIGYDEKAITWDLDCLGNQKLGIHGKYLGYKEKTLYRIKNDGTVLQVLGDINEGFSDLLKSILSKNPKITEVSLGSGGGSVVEAINAGMYIRSKGLDTSLWNSCYSACPLVFFGGVSRNIMAPYPKLGLHKVYTSLGALPRTDPVYSYLYRYLSLMGVDPTFVIGTMWQAEPNDMKTLDANDDSGLRSMCSYKLATWIQRMGC